MRTRHDILNEVLELNNEIEKSQQKINSLYLEVKEIKDIEDDEDKSGFSILDNIKSYSTN